MLMISANDHKNLALVISNKKVKFSYTRGGESLLSRAVICRARECFDIIFEQIKLLPMDYICGDLDNSNSRTNCIFYSVDSSGLESIIEYTHVDTNTSPYDYYLTKILEQPNVECLRLFNHIGPNYNIILTMIELIHNNYDKLIVPIKILNTLLTNPYLKKNSSDQLIPIFERVLDYIWKYYMDVDSNIKLVPFDIDEYNENTINLQLYSKSNIIQSITNVKKYLNDSIGYHDRFYMWKINHLDDPGINFHFNVWSVIDTGLKNNYIELIDMIAQRFNILYFYDKCWIANGVYCFSLARPSIHPTIYWILAEHPTYIEYFIPKYSELSIQELNAIPNIKTLFYLLDCGHYNSKWINTFLSSPAKYFSGLKLIFELPIDFDYEYICLKLIDGVFRTLSNHDENDWNLLLLFWLGKNFSDKININKIINNALQTKLIMLVNKYYLTIPKNISNLLYVLSELNYVLDTNCKIDPTCKNKYIKWLIKAFDKPDKPNKPNKPNKKN
jgi:hypothetical protein